MTSRELIDNRNERVAKRSTNPDNGWGERHYFEYIGCHVLQRGKATPQAGVVGVIEALAVYADAHKTRFDSTVGEDYVLGAGWSQIALGALVLLNGETGRLDCGTLDGLIRDMMTLNNVDPDTGDLGYTAPTEAEKATRAELEAQRVSSWTGEKPEGGEPREYADATSGPTIELPANSVRVRLTTTDIENGITGTVIDGLMVAGVPHVRIKFDNGKPSAWYATDCIALEGGE